jgi:hypothetical protein
MSSPRLHRNVTLLLSGALSISPSVLGQDLDVVELDVTSGIASDRLPFDVPFLLTGRAPAGSIQLDLQVQEKHASRDEFPLEWNPATPLTSAIGTDGIFRVRLGPFDADRDFRFLLAFERRLSSGEAAALRREVHSALDRELRTLEEDFPRGRASSLGAELRLSLERALNEGTPISSARGSVAVEARGGLFGDDSGDAELQSLSKEVLARQAERDRSLRLYRETAPTFEEDLDAIRSAAPLRTLLAELERRPELDPRNPRNELFLAEEAMRLVRASDAEISAVARGRSLVERPIDLEGSFRPEDAGSFRSRYLRTSKALRDLRDWLQSLTVPGARNRATFDRLVSEGVLEASSAGTLAASSSADGGLLSRAEKWAEVLEAYLYDLEKSLLGRERALDSMAAEIESRALSAVIRQTITTEVATTRANLYIGLDLGALYSPELERAAGYFGANIYFVPVNKKASLGHAGSLAKRTSVTFGITLSELVLEDDPRIEPLLGSRYNLVLGAGYRFARSLRVSGGTLLVLKNDPNPLVVDRSLAATPYFAFSFDIDIVGAIRAAAR